MSMNKFSCIYIYTDWCCCYTGNISICIVNSSSYYIISDEIGQRQHNRMFCLFSLPFSSMSQRTKAFDCVAVRYTTRCVHINQQKSSIDGQNGKFGRLSSIGQGSQQQPYGRMSTLEWLSCWWCWGTCGKQRRIGNHLLPWKRRRSSTYYLK